MRTRISDAVFCILVVAALIWSCSKTTIIDQAAPEKTPETYTPRTKSDSTATEDTSRIPITFGVTVEGWKDVERN